MNVTSLFDLDFEGKFIFTYADKANYYILFANDEDKQLYLIITNKYFEVENLYDIIGGNVYFNSKDIIFTKPYNDNFNEFIFKGFILLDGKYHKFNIENYKFNIEEEVEYRSILENLEEFKDFKINHFVQKKNYIYFVGFDNKVEEDVFVVYDLITKKIVYLNSFYSDEEYFVLLNLLFDDDKIIISGYKNNNGKRIPYFTYILNPFN